MCLDFSRVQNKINYLNHPDCLKGRAGWKVSLVTYFEVDLSRKIYLILDHNIKLNRSPLLGIQLQS
jgi:hypothetical protein